MLVYISQMVPYFSLFDTFMDQTSDRSSELRAGLIHSISSITQPCQRRKQFLTSLSLIVFCCDLYLIIISVNIINMILPDKNISVVSSKTRHDLLIRAANLYKTPRDTITSHQSNSLNCRNPTFSCQPPSVFNHLIENIYTFGKVLQSHSNIGWKWVQTLSV